MTEPPEVAVIAGAYHRREYLAEALRSVAEQTVPAERVELIVTKNYVDPPLDRALADRGATVLLDDEPRIGRWLRRAVRASTAPILAFLDDDDAFEPEHLAAALEAFRRFPDVGFYRNRVRVVDAAGRAVPRDRWRAVEVDPAFDTLGPVRIAPRGTAGLAELTLRRTYVTFNSSTMAIRRELLEGELGSEFERTQLPDLFFLLAAVFAGRGLYFDDRRLTRFRFYASNVTHRTEWLAHAERAYADVARVAAARARPDFAELLAEESVHYGRLYRGTSLVDRVADRRGRRDVARRTAEYLRFLARHPKERSLSLDTWAAAAYGTAYLGWPSIAARVARARRRERGVT